MGGISPSAMNMAYNNVVRHLAQRPSLREKVEQMMHPFVPGKDLILSYQTLT